jgi:hypothetical protein
MTLEIALIIALLMLALVLYGLVALCLGREGRRLVETCTRRPSAPGNDDVLFAPHAYRQHRAARHARPREQ